jgi:hypothetical protein
MQAGDAVALRLAHADMRSGGTQREVVEVSANSVVTPFVRMHGIQTNRKYYFAF